MSRGFDLRTYLWEGFKYILSAFLALILIILIILALIGAIFNIPALIMCGVVVLVFGFVLGHFVHFNR